jgi:hypothetical protein
MRNRLLTLAAALILAGVLGTFSSLAEGPTHVFAEHGFGVRAGQTGSTGQMHACDVHAANVGVSAANGLVCVSYDITLQYDPTTCSLTINGSGLIPGSEVWFYSDGFTTYYDAGTVDTTGNFTVTYPNLGFSDTVTVGAYAAGDSPVLGAAPYFSVAPYPFTC